MFRRPGFILFLVSALTVGLFGFGVWAVGWSGWLSVDTIEVKGAKLLAEQDVIAAANLRLGVSQALIDTADVAEQIAGLPQVGQVQVLRKWPHGLEITIAEREAKVSVRYGTGYLFADADGVVFSGGPSNNKKLLQVSAPPDRDLLCDILAVHGALSKETAGRVQSISATTRDSITLHLSKSVTVNWGSVSEPELKSQVLDLMLEQDGNRIDVSAPATPTIR
ncbi:MAG: FtsQ-type POTRA domain-containing protein [Propionibacteriaceae bacterium]|jgi:cell division protein FtsQ|nr:FtsQ-type POTRA domain-containing protein [Propionibacteriaceae bacterium]